MYACVRGCSSFGNIYNYISVVYNNSFINFHTTCHDIVVHDRCLLQTNRMHSSIYIATLCRLQMSDKPLFVNY